MLKRPRILKFGKVICDNGLHCKKNHNLMLTYPYSRYVKDKPRDLDPKVIKNKLTSYNSKYLYWILFVFKNYAYKTMLLVIR